MYYRRWTTCYKIQRSHFASQKKPKTNLDKNVLSCILTSLHMQRITLLVTRCLSVGLSVRWHVGWVWTETETSLLIWFDRLLAQLRGGPGEGLGNARVQAGLCLPREKLLDVNGRGQLGFLSSGNYSQDREEQVKLKVPQLLHPEGWENASHLLTHH